MRQPKMLTIAFDPIYAHPLPVGHRFPMLKYELIPEQLLYEGSISGENLFRPGICADEIILRTHDGAYLQRLKNQQLSAKEQRHIGFPQSPALTLRELIITQGTIDCCHHALENGISMNVAGGTHHAFADRGEGFCMLNDFAIAANYLLHRNLASQILIIDLDVHQQNFSRTNPAFLRSACMGGTTILFIRNSLTLMSLWKMALLVKLTCAC
jgi:acetoin utilization deacetylase AcuC-like enzyme